MAPSQHPPMKKLSNLLAEAERMAYKGLGKTKAFCASQVCLHEMGNCGLDVYIAMGRAGDTTVKRLITAFMVQRILKRKDQNGDIVANRSDKTGQVHPLIPALMASGRDQSWFTITEEQAVLAENYCEGEEFFPPGTNVRDYFHIARQSPSPTPVASQSMSRSLTPVEELGRPKAQQATQSTMSRPAGPQGQQSQLFRGSLRNAEWNDLYHPPRVLPGNLVPGTFLGQPTVSGGMYLNANTTPISMLGQGCAKEARKMASTTREFIEYLRQRVPDTQNLPAGWEDFNKKDMLRLALPFNPDRVNKGELREYIHKQHDRPREIEHALNRWAELNGSDSRRFEHWDVMFARIGQEQASNPRPGLWTYPQEEAVDELLILDAAVQRAIVDEARYKYPSTARGQASGFQAPGPPTQRRLFPSLSQPKLPASSSQGSMRQGSQPRLPASSSQGSMRHGSQPRLPASSSQGSLWQAQPPGRLTGSSSRGHAVQAQAGGWIGRADSEEPDQMNTPTNRRHGPRNLYGAAAQPRPGDEDDDDDDDDDDFGIVFSQGRPSSRGRRKRESTSGASAHGRPAKSPSKTFRSSRQ